jgi:hypothetical protein
MRSVATVFLGVTVAVVRAGCVVVPAHRQRAYVGVPAPLVVVHPYHYLAPR